MASRHLRIEILEAVLLENGFSKPFSNRTASKE